MPIRVADAQRHFVTPDGRPFFWLADTAWELIRRCGRGEVDFYLANRASKGFSVVQTVVLSELNGLSDPNAQGDLPLRDLDPRRPNEAYFEHVDYVVTRAREWGLHVAMLPTWGAYVVKETHPLFASHQLFDEGSAFDYGRWLAARYRTADNLVWVLGGDRDPDGYEAVWTAMATGLREGDGGAHLITYHPRGPGSSARLLHGCPWLDFNMVQSGHARRANNNYALIADARAREPAKPVLDGEPNYEDLPVNFAAANGQRFGAVDCRNAAWWSVLAGACGHTYGCNAIWQMWAPPRQPILEPRCPWKQALDLPGAYQMRWVRRVLEARRFATLFPDESLLLGEPGFGTDHRAAARDGTPGARDATTIVAYFPLVGGWRLDTSAIAATRLRAWWVDPRRGVAYDQGAMDNAGEFRQPWNTRPWETLGGPDWVLVVDDASRGYASPGA